MNPARDLIDAIHSVAELEFWGVPENLDSNRVPLVIWRYAERVENVARIETITKLLSSVLLNRRVSWALREPGRNWVLAPQAFLQIEDSGHFRLFREIVSFLEETDPDLGCNANRDLGEIALCAINALAEWRCGVRH